MLREDLFALEFVAFLSPPIKRHEGVIPVNGLPHPLAYDFIRVLAGLDAETARRP